MSKQLDETTKGTKDTEGGDGTERSTLPDLTLGLKDRLQQLLAFASLIVIFAFFSFASDNFFTYAFSLQFSSWLMASWGKRRSRQIVPSVCSCPIEDE